MKKITLIITLIFISGILSAQNWQEIITLASSDGISNDDFGYCVSISGDYAIVGAHNEDEDINGENYLLNAGSAYLFFHNEGVWEEIQ